MFRDVDVPPSPNVQDQPVGVFVDVSVNETVCPIEGFAGEKVKPATGGGGVDTVTCFAVWFEPPAFVATRATLNVPAVA